jgi:hypothetical protein
VAYLLALPRTLSHVTKFLTDIRRDISGMCFVAMRVTATAGSTLARTLGSWVRKTLKAWMFGVCMRLFCVCVILSLNSGLAECWALVQGVLPFVKI